MSEVIDKPIIGTLDLILDNAGFSDAEASVASVIPYSSIGQGVASCYASRLKTALAILLANGNGQLGKQDVQSAVDKIDLILNEQIDCIIKHENFKNLERNWRAVESLATNINDSSTKLSILHATKDEISDDFDGNSVEIMSSDLFQQIYVNEYDQFGGEPFGSIIGLYSFDRSPDDIEWLTTMGKVAAAAHAPFIAAINPSFFGEQEFSSLRDIKDVNGLMKHPKYNRWNAFRKSRSAAYIGLTMPNYMIRAPYDPENNPVGKGSISTFKESIDFSAPHKSCLWGSAAIPFAVNLFKSFEVSGWCQSICGVNSGGLVEDLPIFSYSRREGEGYVLPTDFLIPDHKEYALAEAGFIPFVYEKKTSNACFFSAQSVKISEVFEDNNDSENSQLITKLPYTFTMGRIAHYVKCYTRDVIGSEADATIINDSLTNWISEYITVTPNPTPLTRQYYPFKAASIEVSKTEGMVGWYSCQITVLPHIKFEGMNVTMKIDTRLMN